jgi:NAD+ kinase
MKRKLRISIEGRDKDSVHYASKLLKNYDIEISEDHPDMIEILGGDGSIYHKKRRRPILPIRLVDKTSQGFFADCSVLELKEIYDMLEEGKYRIEEHLTLDTYLNNELISNAINDVYVHFKDPRKAIRFDVRTNGNRLFESSRLVGDGVIVATSLGSTGYNASAGGYVVNPKEDKVVVTLNNPVGIGVKKNRSKVIDSNSEIEIEVYRPQKLWLCIDGCELLSILNSDKIRIKKSKETFKLVKIEGMEESWYEKLRRRKQWIRESNK